MLSIKKILCPTDFSEFSYEALDKAGELATHFGAELCVLYVTQPVTPVYGIYSFSGSGAWMPAYEQAVHQGAAQELESLRERPQLQNIPARFLARKGNPADEIVEAAEEEKADLIVIATHGLTGWRSHIFGSVAEKVLRLARCPVLIKRAQAAEAVNFPLPPRRILCSTDFSEPSFAALQVAGQWASHFDAELFLIHVVEPLDSPSLIMSREQIEEAMQAEAVQQLHAVLRERVPQLAAARPIVRKGSAADEIAAAAEQEKADLIVIATSGAGGWRTIVSGTSVERILFGSVTTNVIRLTSRPILTVRLPPEPGVFEVE